MNLNIIKSVVLKFFVLVSTFSLYVFLFEDYFEVDPYGETAVYYAVCATFLTLYLWKMNRPTN